MAESRQLKAIKGYRMEVKEKFSKQEVIELILKMLKFNQREQAVETISRENELHPDWKLNRSVKEALKAQA